MSTEERVLLAQISDLHVQVGAGDRTTAARVQAVVAAVRTLDPAPDSVLVTGDLVHNGVPAEYDRVADLLAPLRMPVHVLAGNHDDREALRAALGPLVGEGQGSFVQYTARSGPLRLVVCDTTEPGQDGGRLCEQRLAFIDEALAGDRDTPTVLAMHHPPLRSGIRVMDEVGLDDASRIELAAVLARAPNVSRVVAGHVHRAMFGRLGACTVFTCPSTDLAIQLDLSGSGEITVVDEPPAFALHLAASGSLTTHVQPVN
jgi:3',5'-cyclic-AMP phosphodiesterase